MTEANLPDAASIETLAPAPSTNGKTSKTSVEPITLQKLDKRHAIIPIKGLTPLIVHKFGEKERSKMRDLQQQKTRKKREPKDPMAEYEASMYTFEDGGYGFPAVGFKSAIVAGARFFEGFTMVSMKTAVHVLGDPSNQLVRIEGEPKMREDTVRLATGVSDLRYRAEFWPWRAQLEVVYIANVISLEALVNLTNAGGMCGVGEWRPSAPKSLTGLFGTFEVEESEVADTAA